MTLGKIMIFEIFGVHGMIGLGWGNLCGVVIIKEFAQLRCHHLYNMSVGTDDGLEYVIIRTSR